MKKTLIVVVLLLICAVCGFALARSMRTASASVSSATTALPSAYKGIRIGMNESQVVADLGRPASRTVNPQYVVKTDQEWNDIQTDLQTASQATSDGSAAPSLQLLKLGAELHHRVKDTLRYDPTSSLHVLFTFDGSGRLLQVMAVPASKAQPAHGR